MATAASKGAGEVHSIRLPAGTARELHDLTGERVSTTARRLMLAYIERARREGGEKAQ